MVISALDDEHERFSDLLKSHRMAIGLSQEEVAERARLSINAVGALERGTRLAPRRETVDALASALDLDALERGRFEASARRARTLGARGTTAGESRTNLPRQLTRFVGRKAEIDDIRLLLGSHAAVTIVGTGGIGKTRVALELAATSFDKYPGGVWFADLSAFDDPDLVVSRLLSVFGISVDAQRQAALGALLEFLRNRQLLLIVDNCEHLLAETARVASRILQAAPHVRILATSRERLGIKGEVVYRLPSLSVPPLRAQGVEAESFDSVTLFADRAGNAAPGFALTAESGPIVIDICRRLEGIPLAIELAAARIPTLGLSEMQRRLDDHLTLLNGGRRDAAPRQQTLSATFAWSYALLDQGERLLLRRLSIFAESWTLEAATAVCAVEPDAAPIGDTLSSLVEKSLVACEDHAGSMRYRLLKSMRTFAKERLATDGDEAPALARRHASWTAELADRAGATLWSTPQLRWLGIYYPEIENARAAIDWALGPGDEPLIAGRILAGMRGVWKSLGDTAEMHGLANAVLDRIDPTSNAEIVALLHRAIILVTYASGKSFFPIAERALAALERVGDKAALGAVKCLLGTALLQAGDVLAARAASERGLADMREADNSQSYPYVRCLADAALVRLELRERDIAQTMLDEAGALARKLKDDYLVGYVEASRAFILYWDDEFARAVRLTQNVLAKRWFLPGGLDDTTLYINLAGFRIALGDHEQGLRAARYAVERSQGRSLYGFYSALQHMAAALALTGKARESARVLGYVRDLGRRQGWSCRILGRKSLTLASEALARQLLPDEIAYAKAVGSELSERSLLLELKP